MAAEERKEGEGSPWLPEKGKEENSPVMTRLPREGEQPWGAVK